MTQDVDKTKSNQPESQVWQAALAGLLHDVGKTKPELKASDRSELVELTAMLSAGGLPTDTLPKELVTIFDHLSLGSHKPRMENFLPLAPLQLDRATLFPVPAQDPGLRDKAYDELFQALASALKETDPDPQVSLEQTLFAMQRLMWCVPSAYYHTVPDVSMYDHSRMTAALAACLADREPVQVRELLDTVRREFSNDAQNSTDAMLDNNLAVLIGGDISGVQDFIYTLTSQEAAKTLRGRSFYLQLLGEAVLRFVLRELGLPYTNVIYSGGGNFFVLAPLSAEQELPRLRQAVADKLLTHHGSAMYLALGATPVPVRGFKRGEFKNYWDKMHRAIGKAKQQRYQELHNDLYARVFQPQANGGNREKTCGVCGEELANVAGEEGERKCALCDSFIELGRKLTHADFVALGFSMPQPTSRLDAASALRAFGMQFEFAQDGDKFVQFPIQPERAVVWALDDLKKGKMVPSVQNVPTARMTRYTVNRIPQFTFDELQEKSKGIARLGVLRMDVDNLGDLFGRGFGQGKENLATLARISTLSFQLGLFFEGWVKKICADSAYNNLVYAVYAGGDDVFLIAPWSIVPDLARRIVQDLNTYTARNSDVHASAGMTFIHGKYPVYQAADDAHEALAQAKQLEGKDAFGFLGQAWKWSEFENVHEKFERLKHLIIELGAQQAMLQTLRQFAQAEARAAQDKKKPVWGRWMWLGAYKLTRDADRAKEPLKSELVKLRDELGGTNYRDIAQWGAAARWVQLLMREKHNAGQE